MQLPIPDFSLVVLVGASGSGKSTFARQHFLPTEVISSDVCRGLVSDDENNLAATDDAFELVHYMAAKRLKNRKLTVIDATNVQSFGRQPLVALARKYHALPVAIVLDMPEQLCHARNADRPDRDFGPHVVRNQRRQLRRSRKQLRREGFRQVHLLTSPEEVAAVTITRQPLWCDRRDLNGPFDFIGDVHGCADELTDLLAKLDYTEIDGVFRHSEGRTAIFVGDLVDRGPANLRVCEIVRQMVQADTALCVAGNHDDRFLRYLKGRKVTIQHGLEVTVAELDALPPAERGQAQRDLGDFLDALVSHYVLDGGKIVVAHAGLRADLQNRASRRVRDFALYGDVSGEIDEDGLPVRNDWAADYRGTAKVIYGHTPVAEPLWVNGAINLDTGCVFGGKLTALRYPEQELVQVEARARYAEPRRPFLPEDLPPPPPDDRLLHLEDVQGRRVVTTGLWGNVTIREENAAAALEAMSRFALDPRWLIYLPPTMSPSETSQQPGLLEHPAEAFAYYRKQGLAQVICEEKHMGSRALVIVCKDAEAAQRRFGIASKAAGCVYTRTGRAFFNDAALEAALLARVRAAMDRAGFWEEFETEWACLDAELMPWSAKAQALLEHQYAAVGAAARTAFPVALDALAQAEARGLALGDLRADFAGRAEAVTRYTAAYRHYCWPVQELRDLKLAPFHLLATEGHVHHDRDHAWHMETLGTLADADLPPEDAVLMRTPYRLVDLHDSASEADATAWWTERTEAGGEGMVVKPDIFLAKGKRGYVQPALKCRGREYLRIIYGPTYDAPEHLARLRQRSLKAKRSLAMREFALGLEALERFVEHTALRRVHECVFGVLALESEPIDPRL